MTIFVLSGMKYGDICASALPILYRTFKETDRKQTVLVSEKYASIFEGVSYVLPEIWTGEWDDLRGAIKYAKTKYSDVVILSTHGKNWPVDKRTPSFQLDQWLRAGRLDQFDNPDLPLVFDLRSKERELFYKGVPTGKSFILLGDKSESSPFQMVDDLYLLLKDSFPKHEIVKLSEIHCEKIYDLCGLYDKASALVSIECVHLHLSKASGVPVVALVTDKPEFWSGTAYQKRFLVHCRYGDYQFRRPEIVKAVQDAIALRSQPEVTEQKTVGYNPSIIEFNGVRHQCWRYHPAASWRTDLVYFDGTNSHTVKVPEKFKEHSIEDGRFFIFKGKLHLSYTVAKGSGKDIKCVVQYGQLEPDGRLLNTHQPAFKGNDFTSLQKNWSFIESGGKLFAAVHRSPEQIVIELDGDKVVAEHKTKTPECSFGTPRGGTFPIVHGDKWVQFFHTNRINKLSPWWWNYSVGALLMDTKPPFQITAISKSPILIGNEKYWHGWPFWKAKVVIAYGAILKDDEFHVSIGANDSACAVVKLKTEDLNI